jgi:hypothetical protein
MSQLDIAGPNARGYPAQQQRSNIPTMRRDRRKQQEAAAHTLRERQSAQNLRERQSREQLHSQQQAHNSSPDSRGETRWDAMTGEPTNKPTGRAGQVKPIEYAQGISHVPAPPVTQRTASQSFGDRVRRMRPGGGGPPPSAVPQPLDARPEWRGGSGRTTLVEPVRDMPDVAPLNIPRKSSKRTGRAASGTAGGLNGPLSPVSPSGSETSLGAPPTIRRIVPSSQQLPTPLETPVTRGNAQAYPSPPNSGSANPPKNAAIHALAQPLSDKQSTSLQHAPNPEIGNANSEKAIRRKPPPSAHANVSHAPQPSTSSSVYSTHPAVGQESTLPPFVPPPHQTPPNPTASDGWTQPPSRFSVTTYATSANTGSPRESLEEERPPMPTMPAMPTPPQPSILDRKRPMVSGYDYVKTVPNEPIVISMATPYMSSPFTSNTTAPIRPHLPSQRGPPPRANTVSTMMSTGSRPASILSTTKALPPAPPEMESVHDRVAHLNARLESLGNRRININKSIKQMTELMPTDNLMASEAVIRKREIEKRKVEGLKQELAEVQREEYELGLKLHRAYKRMDKNAEYEPTTLWVRRVTG